MKMLCGLCAFVVIRKSSRLFLGNGRFPQFDSVALGRHDPEPLRRLMCGKPPAFPCTVGVSFRRLSLSVRGVASRESKYVCAERPSLSAHRAAKP
ncbi:MAG: hypothetical protein QOI77_1688 [Blastocatellia bacterium]|nr:hypothetical protein [Blastocatellia bacterium]